MRVGGGALEVMRSKGGGVEYTKRGREEGRERGEITTLVFSFGINDARTYLENPASVKRNKKYLSSPFSHVQSGAKI